MELSDQEIRNILLKSAYEQREKGWVKTRIILRETDLGLRNREAESHLFNLCDQKLMDKKQESTSTTMTDPYTNKPRKDTFKYYLFRITAKGERYVMNGFKFEKLPTPLASINVVRSQNVMISSPHGQQTINNLNPEISILLDELKTAIESMTQGQEKSDCMEIINLVEEELIRNNPRKKVIEVALENLMKVSAIAAHVATFAKALGF